eukprot:3550590-Ditylum_brightwellii.AAC.1
MAQWTLQKSLGFPGHSIEGQTQEQQTKGLTRNQGIYKTYGRQLRTNKVAKHMPACENIT